ncbi:hypothetical protein AVEN_154527-1, partial [Araneus ventricosus]
FTHANPTDREPFRVRVRGYVVVLVTVMRTTSGLYRTVEYTAGADGYRVCRSNEPGLGSQDGADANYMGEPPPPDVVALQIFRNFSTEILVAEI